MQEIKVGQRWRRRDGSEVRIMQVKDGRTYPVLCNAGCTYLYNGYYTILGQRDPLDLVELISHAPDATLADVAAGIPDEPQPAADAWASVADRPPQDDFGAALCDATHPYHLLADALVKAFNQAASGKGKDRHANDGVRFEEQPMSTINRALGSVDGFIYQSHKKSLESKRLPDGRAQAELMGAINYLAGAMIALDTWAKQ